MGEGLAPIASQSMNVIVAAFWKSNTDELHHEEA